MKRVLISLIPLLVASFIVASPFSAAAQDREKFVISARAGGVNAVTGRAALRVHGNGEWQQLTVKEDLQAGDVVKTALDGRVEMLLNPGSYLRIGENSEVELTDNSLENLELRLIRGTAILEVTGNDDTELLINVTTPHTRMAIVRRGLYRVNVVPGDATELIVRKGRVMLERTHTKIKGGDKVVFSDNSFSVAKLQKSDKTRDDLEAWSKGRAETLARANSKISNRDLKFLLASSQFDWWMTSLSSRSGCWLYDPIRGFYTFFPFAWGWGSPYGSNYSTSLFGGYYGFRGYDLSRGAWTGGTSGGGNGNGSGGGIGSGASNNPRPVAPAGPVSEPRVRDTPSFGRGDSRRPVTP
ncbi:MAG: FecR domain-containing protein [bacterium]